MRRITFQKLIRNYPNFNKLSLKGLLDYTIKIAATWVACKKLHARIARPFTLRIQHRAIFERVSVIGFQQRFGDCVPICDCVSKT